MSDRLVSPKMSEEEQAIETSLRPRRLSEYIGQEKIKENLSILLEAARRRKESVDHVLLYGPPGLGDGGFYENHLWTRYRTRG